jgi:hypothetical protein
MKWGDAHWEPTVLGELLRLRTILFHQLFAVWTREQASEEPMHRLIHRADRDNVDLAAARGSVVNCSAGSRTTLDCRRQKSPA